MGIISLDPAVQVILIPVIIFALSFHEFAHGWMANRFGDQTAKINGRLTLNPMAHLDVFGSLALYFMGFGWAKPVPVNPRNLTNPKNDLMWIALAGPLSNFLLAFISGVLLSLFLRTGIIDGNSSLTIVLVMSLQINLVLAIFNFLPIAPLDGSKILAGIVPARHHHQLVKLEYYGPRVLIGIILISILTGFSIFSIVISPIMSIFLKLFTFGIF